MIIDLIEIKDKNVEFVKNLWAFASGRTITFQEYIALECKEIFGDDNKWFSGENIMRPPTNLDCQKNYINYRADRLFHKKCHYLVERNWQKRLKKFKQRALTNLKNFPNITQKIGKVNG